MLEHPPNQAKEASNPFKTAWNLLTAVALFLTSLALVYEDWTYPGDLMFLTPSNSMVLLVVLALGWFSCALFFSVFPKRFLFLVIGLLVSRTAFGFPLNLFMENSQACLSVSVMVLISSFVYLVVSIFRRNAFNVRPWFRPRHSLAVGISGAAVLGMSLPFMLGGFATGARNLLGDFTRVSLTSISLVERVFQREGRKVFLAGMMHIGEGAFYDQLNERMGEKAEGSKSIVLAEGVADRENLLPDSFASGATYAKWARWLGLEVQSMGAGRKQDSGKNTESRETWEENGVSFVRADIDISELPEKHRSILIKALQSLESVHGLMHLDIEPYDFEVLMKEGLIQFRNDRLMEHFDKALSGGYERIYIPWGAAHLPDIEERLTKMGFQKIHEEVRPVIRFWER